MGDTSFPQEQQAVGNIDFNQELLTQVFTPYQGRILKAFASVGEIGEEGPNPVHHRQPRSVQAESTLIATAGVLELTAKALERQRNLYQAERRPRRRTTSSRSPISRRPKARYRAARAAVKVFGKTRRRDRQDRRGPQDRPALVVPSPITGLITARNAAPGLFVQPGNPPPVYIVADTSTMWMLANVPEKDAPALKAVARR